MKAANLIEIDGPSNQNVYFRPIQSRVRGRFDFHRCRNGNAGKLSREWPEPIPGQVLGIDTTTGEGYIREPLYDPQHTATRKRIEDRGMNLPEERQTFTADVATWLFHMAGLVEGETARLVSGKIPDKLPGTPQQRFHSAERADPIDRLAAAIEKQTELLVKLVNRAVGDA